MFYRYHYDDQGNIRETVSMPGRIGQTQRVVSVNHLPYIDSEQYCRQDQYKVDTNTNTLVAKDQ
jgi:hypothetical protein